MKAIILDQNGGPDALRYGEAPDPMVSGSQVVVRLHAAGINHVDLWVRRGSPAYPLKAPHIPGADGAGVVESVGPDAEGVQPGDRVLIFPGISCGECPRCKSGHDNQCDHYEILGTKRNGTYAERIVVPDQNVVAIPDDLPFDQAAAFPLAYLTAWHMLHGRAALKNGETVYVTGGSSGVGIAAIQLARAAGAQVYASTTAPAKVKALENAGATVFLLRGDANAAKWLAEHTGNRGVDVVIETVGPVTWEASLAALGRGGRLVTCGETSGSAVSFPLRSLFSRDASILGARMGTQKEFMALSELVFEKKIVPVIDQTFPLKEAAEAHLHLENRKQVGKVVLTID